MIFEPIIIIGAPRSGTNMLRDVLCSFDCAGTWPCDEINYIWRHGNIRYSSDEIPPNKANVNIKNYINQKFLYIARKNNTPIVIEKTCANSLRIPFVDAVLPNAKYIFIHRHGLDAIGSAMQRWSADLEFSYLARKARFVPLSDIPYYSLHYLWNRLYLLWSPKKHLAFWGPKLMGMNKLMHRYTLDEVCALQWQACMEKATTTLELMPEEKWLKVSYEEFVLSPKSELKRIASFIGLDFTEDLLTNATSNVTSNNLGKGRALLDTETTERLTKLISPTLEKHSYT